MINQAISEPAVSLRSVGKKFGKGPLALNDVTFDVAPSEIFGVIGHSGAGKSTLVRLINGLEKPSTGRVIVGGTDITELSERNLRTVRHDIGMIFQQFNLIESRPVSANIEFALEAVKWPRLSRKKRTDELLEFVGLADKAKAYPGQLSGGQKQRVGIARALAGKPGLLLADEATSALDPETTRGVLALLKTINRELGVTIVVITHEMDVIRTVADRVAVLSQGRVVELDTTFNIFAHPRTAVAQKFVEASNARALGTDDRTRVADTPGTLVTLRFDDPGPAWKILGAADSRGVSFTLVHGGVTPIGTSAHTAITLALTGADDDIQALVDRLDEVAEVAHVY